MASQMNQFLGSHAAASMKVTIQRIEPPAKQYKTPIHYLNRTFEINLAEVSTARTGRLTRLFAPWPLGYYQENIWRDKCLRNPG